MNLVEIIRRLTSATTRATHELPRGLWLVYYPPTGDTPARLVAGRHLSQPSERELITVRDHLLEVLDANETRVAYDISSWAERDHNDWHGHAITWRTTAVTDAFSPDPDRAALIRRALERRAARIEERRQQKPNRKPADRTAPKPMF